MLNPTFCIIGGGPVGIGIAKGLIEAGLECDIFEKESNFGGLWNIDSKSASRVYDSAHIISPKLITEISDMPMPKNYPHYPSHKQLLQYFLNIAQKLQLYDRAVFNTEVTELSVNADSEVILELSSGEKRKYQGAVIANGLLNQQLLPKYSGRFTGKLLHSQDYRNIDEFRGKRVLVVGAGNSGCDIVCDLARHVEKLVHSTRRAYHYMPKFIYGLPTHQWMMDLSAEHLDSEAYWQTVKQQFKIAGFDPVDYGLPEPDYPIYACHPILNSQILYYLGHGDISYKPDVSHYEGSTVYFNDGSSDDFDVVIYATGFRPHFPFLNTKQFNANDVFSRLYLRCLDKRYDNIIFSGYFNSPAGLGNMLNFGGKLAALIFKAFLKKNKALKIIQQLKQGPEPDLGSGHFIQSDRHKYEYDLWKTVKYMKFMISRIQELV